MPGSADGWGGILTPLMQTDIKREVIAEPVYTSLRDGRQAENSVPQVAAVGTVSIKSGGWEDE